MPVYSFSFDKDAPKVPFRPSQCPTCDHNKNEKCEAYSEKKPLPLGTSTITMDAVFEGESQESCPKYKSHKT